MGLRLVYESGAANQTTEIGTDRLRSYVFDVTEHAEEGSVALSAIPVDDPNANLDVIGWRRVWAYEDTATGSNSLIYHGWVGPKTVTRGMERTGGGRLWTVSVADQNTTLGFRILTAASANRPDETDVARVQWLVSVTDSFGRAPIAETEFLATTSTVLMDAADYRGQTPLDVVNDCAQQSGKNYFVYTKDNGYPAVQPTRGLWYGFNSLTTYTSPLRLSNVATDVDGVATFAIGDDTELERKPDRVFSGAYVQYQSGAVYEQLAGTYNQFTQRDALVSAPNVRTSGAATRRAQRYLADLDTEEDRITTSFYVPAAKVNFVKPGMRIQVRMSHFPGYESFVYLRVLSRSVSEVTEDETATEPKYKVALVLSSDDIPAAIPPSTSYASAVLYQPKNGGGGGILPEIRWVGSGTSPPTGDPFVPLQGSLEYVEDSILPGAPFKGVRALGNGTVTITFTGSDIAGVTGSVTCIPSIMVNGGAVATSTHSTNDLAAPGYPYGHSVAWNFAVTVAVSSGDVISALMSSTWGPTMTVPAGTERHRMTVTGNLT